MQDEQTALVLTWASIKGGVGKSSQATEAAAGLAALGVDVAILDTDAPQYSAAGWAQLRLDAEARGATVPYATCDVDELVRTTRAQSGLPVVQNAVGTVGRGRQLVIVDAGGNDELATWAAIAVADLVVVPLEPADFAMWSDSRLAKMITTIWTHRPGLQVLGVLNGVHTHPVRGPRSERDARKAYSNDAAGHVWNREGGTAVLLGPSLKVRSAWDDRQDGRTLSEVEPGGKAAAEWADVFSEIVGALEGLGLTIKENHDAK